MLHLSHTATSLQLTYGDRRENSNNVGHIYCNSQVSGELEIIYSRVLYKSENLKSLPDNVMMRAWGGLSRDVCEAEKHKQSEAAAVHLTVTVTPLNTAGLLMDN